MADEDTSSIDPDYFVLSFDEAYGLSCKIYITLEASGNTIWT